MPSKSPAQAKLFPEDAKCYAYEGEVVGIIVVSKDGKEQLGRIDASEGIDEDQ